MRAINDYVKRIQFISIKLSAYVAGTYGFTGDRIGSLYYIRSG